MAIKTNNLEIDATIEAIISQRNDAMDMYAVQTGKMKALENRIKELEAAQEPKKPVLQEVPRD